MCTLRAMQLMVNVVDLLSQLRSAKLQYISNIGAHALTSMVGIKSEYPVNRSFYETIIQTFRNIVLLIKENIDDEKVINNTVFYLKELNSIIKVPNYERQNIDKKFGEFIQEAIDCAQYKNNSELRDLLIECKSNFNS